ncbi:hypothetical protein Trydic_g11415 [Trypoxylus dichotomus]
MKSVEYGDLGYEKIVLQWAAECDDLSEHPNIELVSGEYSGYSSDDGNDNSEDDDEDIARNKIVPLYHREPGLPRKHMTATLKEALQKLKTVERCNR